VKSTVLCWDSEKEQSYAECTTARAPVVMELQYNEVTKRVAVVFLF